MKKASSYERIKDNIGADGKLPHAFTLEKITAPNQIGFMPGAMDGVGVFHAGVGNQRKLVRKIVRLLKKYFRTADERHIAKIEATFDEIRTISIVDKILNQFRNAYRDIRPNKMVDLCIQLITTSDNLELVKLGIALLGIFDLSHSNSAVEAITTLALYEDFTLYSVVTASNWSKGNEIIFQMAKGVMGWGKIHAVEHLKPETEAIRTWLLCSGCENGVMNAYLGLVCAVNGNLISALRKDSMDNELFDGVAIIIDALINEEPCMGISEYEHAQEALKQFLCHAKRQARSIEHLWHILNLRDWAKNAEIGYEDELRVLCDEIISGTNWEEKITAAIKRRQDKIEFFYACSAASRLGIDISP